PPTTGAAEPMTGTRAGEFEIIDEIIKKQTQQQRNCQMKQLLSGSAGILILAAALIPLAMASAEQPAEMNIPAPELKDVEEWINPKPLQLKDLRGKVVVLLSGHSAESTVSTTTRGTRAGTRNLPTRASRSLASTRRKPTVRRTSKP